MKRHIVVCLGAILLATVVGCNNSRSGPSGPASFSLAWSEYPSWSVFGVAHEVGLIDKAEGKMGKIEQKWNIDIVLKQLDYDACIAAYGNGTVDAVCITNMDVLAPAIGRKSVAILPTSTSDGADACIVTGIQNVDDLKGKETFGLEKSVSQYTFVRCLQKLGKNPAEFPFRNMDPAAAAQAMQTKQPNINSIVVWNPFVMQTLRTRDGEATRLFDSTSIPEEIIDMVVVGDDAHTRTGGQSFACAIVEAFYEVNRLLESSSKGDATLVALGEKFSNLGLDDMKEVVQQTKFYGNADKGVEIFTKGQFQNETMPTVVDFCVANGIVDVKPTISFGSADSQLRFEPMYMAKIQDEAIQAAEFAKLSGGGTPGDISDDQSDEAEAQEPVATE